MKYNKLIAEFMGAVGTPMYAPKEWDIYITGHLDVDSDNENAQHFFTPKEMKYHTSWDWLMPVVEKIEREYMYSVQPFIQRWEHCIIDKAGENTEDFERIEVDSSDKLSATYGAVVEFIKWYNKNK